VSFSSFSLQKSSLETSSNAAVGASLPLCQTELCALFKVLIKSSLKTTIKSLLESPFLNLYLGAFPYFTGISEITFFCLSSALKPEVSKAVLVFPATTIA
jgi:hypothetical protein